MKKKKAHRVLRHTFIHKLHTDTKKSNLFIIIILSHYYSYPGVCLISGSPFKTSTLTGHNIIYALSSVNIGNELP